MNNQTKSGFRILSVARRPTQFLFAIICLLPALAWSQVATVTVTASDATASELGPDSGTFTFTRSGGNISVPLTIFVTKDGTTTVSGADYSDNNGNFFKSLNQVQIPAGSASFDLIITPETDSIAEGDEQLDITLAANAAYVVGTPNSAGMTIEDFVELIFSDGFE